MAEIESRLITMGLSLPPATQPPAGVRLPFAFGMAGLPCNIPVEIESEVDLNAR